MLKLGTNNIGKIYLGTTEISKAYLGSSLVFDGGSTPPTPTYDAQVEYLGASGTQYIDTGIICDQTTVIEASFRLTNNSRYVYGCRGDNSHSITVFTSNNGNCRFGNQTASFSSWATNTDYLVVQSKSSITRNRETKNYSSVSDFVTPYNLYLMTASGDPTASYFFIGRYYYMKIWKNNALVRDFIPVRVGTTGYLYDRVSGQLFGNSGSGAFTYGNDVTI